MQGWKTRDWKTQNQNCMGGKLGKRRVWTAKCYKYVVVRVVYKWYNVRVLREVHDVGSFLGATEGQTAVESCNVCFTILCRSLQSAGVQAK